MSPTISISIISVTLLALLYHIVTVSISSRRLDLDFDSIEEFFVPSILIGFCIGVVIWFIIGWKNQPEFVQYKSNHGNLSVLKDGLTTGGDFFLGSGSFDGDMKYYGYESLGNDKYQLVKFPSSSIIVEDIKEGEIPYFVELRKHANPNGWAFKNYKWMIGPFEFDCHIHWEIHIPKGSIAKGRYELDME